MPLHLSAALVQLSVHLGYACTKLRIYEAGVRRSDGDGDIGDWTLLSGHAQFANGRNAAMLWDGHQHAWVNLSKHYRMLSTC